MAPESLELARAWLAKAHSDLATARLLINGEEKYLDTGSYHCQQAAEKALKGWLTACEILFPKTHSLEDLLALCVPGDPAFAHFRHHAEELTPLAQEFRYPGDAAEPDAAQAERAYELANELWTFVENRMAEL